MSQATVKVEAIADRQVAGGKTAYSIKGDDGTWYGMAFNKPRFNRGDVVSFEYAMNGKYANINTKTIVVESSKPVRPEPEPTEASSTKPTAAPDKKGDDYWAARDHDVRLAGARNSAIAFVKLAVDTGSIAIPTKEAARLKLFEDLVDHYAAKFYTQNVTSTTASIAELAGGEVKLPKKAATKAKPEETEQFTQEEVEEF